jgi:tetratricopeptide (TPR) repeat protein
MTCDLLAHLALREGDLPRARAWLERALRANRWIAGAHERLGLIALASGQGREAVRELEIERALDPRRPGLALRLGQAWQLSGDANQARKWYQRELTQDPGNSEALDSLRSLR